jgi:hypothetical protein
LVGKLVSLQGREMGVGSFSGTNAIFGRNPPEDIITSMRDKRGRFNIMNSLVIESGAEKMVIPGLGVLVPKIRNFGRQRVVNNRQGEGVMDILPNGAPRLRPNRGVAIVNLVYDIGVEVVSNLKNG